MKKLILISMLTISCAFSCKKSEIAPTVVPTITPPTYSTIDIGVVLINNIQLYCPDTEYSLEGIKSAIIRCNNVTLDSITGLNLIESPKYDFNPCDSAASSKVIHHLFKIQDKATNFIEVYDGSKLIVRCQIVPTDLVHPLVRKDNVPSLCYTDCGNLLAPIR